MTYRIALADDQASMLECIRRIVAPMRDVQILFEARDGAMLLEMLRAAPVLPDLVITDITMPTVSGIEATREIRALYPDTKVLVLTMHPEEDYLFQSLDAGAAGYMVKEDAVQELAEAIRLLRAGGTYVCTCFSPQILDRARSTPVPESHSDGVPPNTNAKAANGHSNENPHNRARPPRHRA